MLFKPDSPFYCTNIKHNVKCNYFLAGLSIGKLCVLIQELSEIKVLNKKIISKNGNFFSVMNTAEPESVRLITEFLSCMILM